MIERIKGLEVVMKIGSASTPVELRRHFPNTLSEFDRKSHFKVAGKKLFLYFLNETSWSEDIWLHSLNFSSVREGESDTLEMDVSLKYRLLGYKPALERGSRKAYNKMGSLRKANFTLCAGPARNVNDYSRESEEYRKNRYFDFYRIYRK